MRSTETFFGHRRGHRFLFLFAWWWFWWYSLNEVVIILLFNAIRAINKIACIFWEIIDVPWVDCIKK